MNQTINAEMQRIYDQYGQLVPDTVVKEASDPDNPLHSRFTWDDDEAAAKCRRAEAGELIRRATIVSVTKDPEKTVRVRAFVSVLDKGERSYVPTKMALTEHRDQVLEQALRDLEAMRRRYEKLIDFDEVLRLALARAQEAAA